MNPAGVRRRQADLAARWNVSGRADDLCRCPKCIAADPRRAALKVRTSRAVTKRLDHHDLRELTT